MKLWSGQKVKMRTFHLLQTVPPQPSEDGMACQAGLIACLLSSSIQQYKCRLTQPDWSFSLNKSMCMLCVKFWNFVKAVGFCKYITLSSEIKVFATFDECKVLVPKNVTITLISNKFYQRKLLLYFYWDHIYWGLLPSTIVHHLLSDISEQLCSLSTWLVCMESAGDTKRRSSHPGVEPDQVCYVTHPFISAAFLIDLVVELHETSFCISSPVGVQECHPNNFVIACNYIFLFALCTEHIICMLC